MLRQRSLLAGLFALWLMGRILNLTGPWPIAAWVDSSFLPALALTLAVLAIGSMVAITLHDLTSWFWGLPPRLFAGLLLLAALAQIIRLCGWQPWRTRANGLLLMLPVAYAWLPAYLLLRATLGDSPSA